MKIRNGFVSNSSSTAFIITNLTKRRLRLTDFVKENPQLIEEFVAQYKWHSTERYNQTALLESAKQRGDVLRPGDNYIVFGDEEGTIIGNVFDYILRDGGTSKRFTWRFKEWLR